MSFLVDFFRFEAARSSKVAIFGLWIGPNSTLGCLESLWLVAKKKRKKSNKLAWFYFMHTPFVRKIVSNPSTCLFVLWFLYERKCDIYRQHIPSSLQPVRRLVLPNALIVQPKEKFFWHEASYLTLWEPGWFNLSRTYHVAPSWMGYCDVIDLSFVIYISMSP